MFKTDRIQYLDGFPEDCLFVRFWDLASSKKERAKADPDWTVGARVAVKEINGIANLYVDDVRMYQGEAPGRDDMIQRVTLEDGPTVWQGVEAVGGFKDAATTLEYVLAGRSVVYPITVSKDKVIRAARIEPLFDAGHVFLRRGAWWTEKVLRQLSEFPSSKHDDIVDAIVGGYELAADRWKRHGRFGGRLTGGARKW